MGISYRVIKYGQKWFVESAIGNGFFGCEYDEEGFDTHKEAVDELNKRAKEDRRNFRQSPCDTLSD